MIPFIKEALKSLGKRPFTVRYPYVKKKPPERLRGKLLLHKEKCIHCGLCERVCPTGACKFYKSTKYPKFNLNICIFCGECAEHCPGKAIELTEVYEMVETDRNKLIVSDWAKSCQ